MTTKAYRLFVLLLAAALACSPKNEEVTDQQVETAPQQEALDSIANTAQDGLKTDQNEVSPNLPMPQPVMQLLTEHYPGWQQPTLTTGALKQAQQYAQGPTIIRGDFNSDNRQDYALQLQQGKEVIMLAVLDGGADNWQVHELRRDILFNERGRLKSLYYLFLTESGEDLPSTRAAEEVEAPHDAVSIGIEKKVDTYIFQGDGFEAYGAGV